jgi:nitrous oxidase accessory protein NosD
MIRSFRFAPLIALGMLWPITATAGRAPEKMVLRPGLVIERSARIVSGAYDIASDDETGKRGAITIRGNDLTVDFADAQLRGTLPTVEPDARKGTGIVVEGSNITLKNLNVRGYKIGLIARHCPGLKIVHANLSYNWKQHLLSTLDREDGSDWMSYHHNEQEEWLRYGAGIYLQDCDNFEIKEVTIGGGQCGLMLTRCNHGLVWNNRFSFLSGLGIGMYRSSENRVMHNKIDWCVRGFSYGVYNRGQDSAGILVFEQCSKNVFAYNSVTHGGDGFFLWAGQQTMDTGEGGCNDNLLFGNDFSHAPTNGIEATFSRNRFVNNRVEECDHGVWGGYSYDTLILANRFARNTRGIAIEHGQHNRIAGNTFAGDGEAIALWQNKTQDPNWGYPKHHDTVSHDYSIAGNLIVRPKRAAFSLRDTVDVRVSGNIVAAASPAFALAGDTQGLRAEHNTFLGQAANFQNVAQDSNLLRSDVTAQSVQAPSWSPLLHGVQPPSEDELSAWKYAPAPLKGGQNAFLKANQLRGRKYILVDQWGPYDFQSPLLWPRGTAPDTQTSGKTVNRFEILGPPGRWCVKSQQGVVACSKSSGNVPDTIDVTLEPGKAVNVKLVLEYVGAVTTDYRGVVTPAGKPVSFGYTRFFAPIDWSVRFFTYDQTQEPRTKPEAFARLVNEGKPVAMLKTDRLDFAGYGAFAPGVPANYFATVADGTFDVPAGDYVLDVVTDDGCRILVDGKTVLDEWHYQGPTPYQVALTLDGMHKIRVEHFQIDGYAALKVSLRPKRIEP